MYLFYFISLYWVIHQVSVVFSINLYDLHVKKLIVYLWYYRTSIKNNNRKLTLQTVHFVREFDSKHITIVFMKCFHSLDWVKRMLKYWENLLNHIKPLEIVKLHICILNSFGQLNIETAVSLLKSTAGEATWIWIFFIDCRKIEITLLL